MFVLGIDTATPVTSVAIGSQAGILASFRVRQERGHARVLVPAVCWLLEQASLSPSLIGAVAVGTGPGLFSGLRVGVSSAKAFAQAWGRPVIPVPSLDLLAFTHRYTSHTICAVIDARRGEVFAAFYRQTPGGVLRVGGYQVVRPDQLAATIVARDEHVLLVGDGTLAYHDTFQRLGGCELGSPAQAAPSAEALVELAAPQLEREQFVSPFEVTPLYLRRPDIDPNARVPWAADEPDGPEPPGVPPDGHGLRPRVGS